MRLQLLLSCLLLLTTGLSAGVSLSSADAAREADRIMELTREEVEERLGALSSSLLNYRVDDAVHRRIVNYIQHWPISSGRVLGRSARFYPIFEEQLRAARLPTELKHLSVVESALRSWAVSPVGAGGLWQLMPETGRELGLIINDKIDERLDPWLGCAAGLEYLRMQYARYGDWALALAAYNSGPGNVNRAIRRSGSRDYWRLRRYLPRETRHYVPNFIAAVFLMTYHHHYGLPASPQPLDEQLTGVIMVDRRLSLLRVAQVTGLRPEVVIEMNPQYTRGYLPGLRRAHSLHLPQRVIPAMRTYLEKVPKATPESTVHLPWAHPLGAFGDVDPDRHYSPVPITVGSTDSLARQVAEREGLPVDRLLVWNNIGEADSLTAGTTLLHYTVAEYYAYDPRIGQLKEPIPALTQDYRRRLEKPDGDPFAGLPAPRHLPTPRTGLWNTIRSWMQPANGR